jgi:hypothetical protein
MVSKLCAVNDENKCGTVVVKVAFLICAIPYLKIQSNNIVVYHYGILATTHNRDIIIAK